MKNRIERLFAGKFVLYLTLGMIILQPIFDLDYLVYPFLHQIGIPRISTIIRFIIMPLCLLLVFFKYEKKKKKIAVLVGGFGLVLGVYFIIHTVNAMGLYDDLILTSNFKFSIFSELTYLITLTLPLVYVYALCKIELNEKLLKISAIVLSCITALPIVMGNILGFGLSTYRGNTAASIFTWFNGIYEFHHPRELASKFFFAEGNTVGILMFIVLPILLWIVYQTKDIKKKIILMILAFLHGIAMVMLSTRVGTYGSIIIPLIVLVAFIFLVIIKKEKFSVLFILYLIITSTFFGAIFPYTPAYVNQQIDAENDEFVREDNGILEDHRKGLEKGEGLIPGSHEYNQFYIYYFEDNAFLISSTPKQYYLEWYNYEFDPKFWVDYIFNYKLEERINGRQFQEIFMNYKWEPLEVKDKLLGMGYSTFMNGSILLEKDFAQQVYTFGYAGSVIIMAPWIVLTMMVGIYVIINWKRMFNMKVFMVMMSIVAGLGNSYISGHTMDQFMTSMFIAFLLGYLLKVCKEDYDAKRK